MPRNETSRSEELVEGIFDNNRQIQISSVKPLRDNEIVRAAFGGKEKSIFSTLKDTNDLILLSILGNDYCTGVYLKAIIERAVANHKNTDAATSKGKTTVLIADEIYWHNLKGMTSSDEEITTFKKQAIELGNTYFTNNIAHFLEPLNVNVHDFNKEHGTKTVDAQITIINDYAKAHGLNFEIVRWSTWIDRNDAQRNILNQIIPLYESVEGLKSAVDETVASFAKRHQDDLPLWRHRSRGYITEESPSVMWLAASLGYNFIIYPGTIPASFAATKEFFVVEKHTPFISKGHSIKDECSHNNFCIHVDSPSRLANWLKVNFKKSHATKEISAGSRLLLFPPQAARDEPMASVDIVMGAFMKGFQSALNKNQAYSPPNLNLNDSASQLAQVFENMTRAILAADLTTDSKLSLMKALADAYVPSAIRLADDHNSSSYIS